MIQVEAVDEPKVDNGNIREIRENQQLGNFNGSQMIQGKVVDEPVEDSDRLQRRETQQFKQKTKRSLVAVTF